jgi:hypothetical protein
MRTKFNPAERMTTMMHYHALRTAVWLCVVACVAFGAPEGKRGGRGKGNKEQPTQNSACLNVPAHPADVVLGRPTQDSVTLSVLAYQDAEGWPAPIHQLLVQNHTPFRHGSRPRQKKLRKRQRLLGVPPFTA